MRPSFLSTAALLGILAVSCQPGPAPTERLAFDVPLRTEALTAAEARDDVEAFVSLVRNAYAGFDAAEAATDGALGRSLGALAAKFGPRVDPVSPADLAQALGAALVGVEDAHFAMTHFRNPVLDRRSRLWASSVEVETWGGALRVVPGSGSVEAGELYEDDPVFLFTSSASGRFRVGLLSPEPWGSATFRIGGHPQTIDLVPSSLPGTPGKAFSVTKTPTTAYLRVASFDATKTGVGPALEEFVAAAEGLRRLQTVVLDLRDNLGGSDASWHRFLGKLYDTDPERFLRRESYRDLESSATEQASARWHRVVQKAEPWQQALRSLGGRFVLTAETRAQRRWSEAPVETGPVPKGAQAFRGRLIALVNRQTASAAESIVPVVRREGGLVVGENTYGAIGFGNVFEYWLPRSGIKLSLAATEFRRAGDGADYLGDGQGYRPDIWTPSIDDLSRVLADLTGEAREISISHL